MINKVKLYLAIIDNIDEGAYFVDLNRKILFWNKAAELISGYSKEEMLNKACPKAGLSHIDSCGNRLCINECPLSKSNLDGEERYEKVLLKHKNGYRIPIDIHVIPLKENDGKIVGSIEIFKRASLESFDSDLIDSLINAATNDILTGLPNRRELMSFLEHMINEYTRYKKGFSLIFMDIDDFSMVNNNYGHDMGDMVLKNIAGVLNTYKKESSIISRFGGEEFVGIFPTSNKEELKTISNNILNSIRNTKTAHNGLSIATTISIGATSYKDGETALSLIKRADKLLYISKENGKNQITME